MVVLALAIWSHRTIESVIAGSIVAFIITSQEGFLASLADAALTVMRDENTGWVLLVCGLYGSFIALLVKGGGAQAFGELVSRHVRNKRQSLLWTWVLGLAIFLDDYLNSLTVSSSMKKVTDKYKTSREMLSYVVASTAAPICLIIPISTWAVYFAGLLEKNGVAAEGEGINVFIQSIPYMFYPFIAVALVPLVICGIVPLIGRMKIAEQRAENTGQVVPAGSEHIEMTDTYAGGDDHNASVSLFFVPIAIPVVFPLAQEVGVSVPLMAGALFSASGFGSHACFYSDSTVLTAQGSGCAPYDHAVSQLPYTLIAAGLSALGFLIVAL
jgi:tetracycline resistance efflux pump